MTERDVPTHPVYCSCCPDHPQVMAQKVGEDTLEIRSRVHGRQHVAVVQLDITKEQKVSS